MAKNSQLSTIKKPPKHLLVIRFSAMGDVAMTVPVLAALTEQYPEVRVTVLTRAFFAPMFAQIPNVSVFAADLKGRHKGVVGLWKLYQGLKPLSVDAVADLHNVLRSNILKRYFLLGKLPFAQIDKGRPEKRHLTAAKNKVFGPLISTHQRYANVFGKLGVPIQLDKASPLARQPLSTRVLEIAGKDAKKWIGIAPFAAFQGKEYPLDLMADVIQRIADTKAYKMFFFGGGTKEKDILDQWVTRFEDAVSMVGQCTFEEELVLISNLDLMLSMDSGNGHLAAIYGIPTITLWGVTHPYAGFYPFKQDSGYALLADRGKYPRIPTSVYGKKLPKGYEKAMYTISPEAVFHKILEVLDSA
ncbi:glycosyltransferase family 9 protein [Flavobacteriaceae bacterium 3-367]|uniref:glycosyltransferase family 9 protein n=1 Tax=Eudoraea algarum TaxID=3417568 RepID=UPI003293B87C